MSIHPLAGLPVPASSLIDISALESAYFDTALALDNPKSVVSFGTSGHRGTSLDGSFTEVQMLAIAQAVCEYRSSAGIRGPMVVGKDTHALSGPAFNTVLEVTAANGVDVLYQGGNGLTPTPAVSHAILTRNLGRKDGLADGLIITPSHNPPEDGGIKYNPPHGGPAETEITSAIEARANELLSRGLHGVKRYAGANVFAMPNLHETDFMLDYVNDLDHVLNMDAIANAGLRLGADPMGGAGIAYWNVIADVYNLDLTVVNQRVDPAFSFMRVDRDGKTRMDCSSPFAMAGLIELRDQFDIAFGNDPDFDRHGIVTRSHGLLNPNHYLSVAISYLFENRGEWADSVGIGKTLVSSSMIDRVAADLGRHLLEVPVGFKWFVDGLHQGTIGFGGEESAGASFLRKDGTVWTTDKDGIIMNLLAAEITAVSGNDPGEKYAELTSRFGAACYTRSEAVASDREKAVLKNMRSEDVSASHLAGESITHRLTHAPGNGAAIGGLKVVTENGWFAARPSGTEDIYKIYAESFVGEDHVNQILAEAKELVNSVFKNSKT